MESDLIKIKDQKEKVFASKKKFDTWIQKELNSQYNEERYTSKCGQKYITLKCVAENCPFYAWFKHDNEADITFEKVVNKNHCRPFHHSL